MSDREKIVSLIKAEKSFNLYSHMQPDGDSVGSLLAMGEMLSALGKNVAMFAPGRVPAKYAFLAGADLVRGEVGIDTEKTTAIVLDSSDLKRLDLFEPAVKNAKTLINIDHHVTNQRFGTLNLVDAAASATGEIVYSLGKELKAPITLSVAEALYVAISTDTGSFKYDNTTSATHLIAAELLQSGLSPGALSQRVFDERPLPFYLLLRDALTTLEFYKDGAIALMTLSKDLRLRCGAGPDDLEGIVNYSRNIEGVELGILFYEDGKKEIKIGFRSKSLDVSELAGRLNGGGHVRAAGCRVQGTFEEAKEKVLKEAFAMYEELPETI